MVKSSQLVRSFVFCGTCGSIYYYHLFRPTTLSPPPLLLKLTAVASAISFVRAALTCPGRIPPSWHSEPHTEVKQKRRDGRPRYCRTCQLHKPDGAHHCRQCKQCTLRMDHHNPWIGNCLGQNNRKYLLLCVGYTAVTMTGVAVRFIQAVSEGQTASMDVAHVVSGAASMLLAVPSALLTGLYVRIMLRRQTNIEYFEGKEKATRARNALEYVQEVMGGCPLKWLVPM
eukprot:PhM_4_TR2913/c0_g1_i1/m.12205/K20029/ZDHHC3_7_25; palmitoyltransferase ZDHHC3/7/25